eukprot:scaffold36454_cov68-Phaeocystis_antarctica.AAC.11
MEVALWWTDVTQWPQEQVARGGSQRHAMPHGCVPAAETSWPCPECAARLVARAVARTFVKRGVLPARKRGIFGLGVVGRRIRVQRYDLGSGILVGFFSSPVRPSLGRTLRLVSANVGTYNAIHTIRREVATGNIPPCGRQDEAAAGRRNSPEICEAV